MSVIGYCDICGTPRISDGDDRCGCPDPPQPHTGCREDRCPGVILLDVSEWIVEPWLFEETADVE